MKIQTIVCSTLLFAGMGFAQAPSAAQSAAGDLRTPEEKHLRNVRQLTFGGSNAEAYFSADGKRLIFQSTRDNLQCDQIFTMNVDGTRPEDGFDRQGAHDLQLHFPASRQDPVFLDPPGGCGLPAASGLFEGLCVGGVSGV